MVNLSELAIYTKRLTRSAALLIPRGGGTYV
jgi:hypothetical protein